MRKLLLTTTSLLMATAIAGAAQAQDRGSAFGNSGSLFVTGSGDLKADNRILDGGSTPTEFNKQRSVAVGSSASQDGVNAAPVSAGVSNSSATFDDTATAGNRTSLEQVNTGAVRASNALVTGDNQTQVKENEQTATAVGTEGFAELTNRGRVRAGGGDSALAEGNSSSIDQLNKGGPVSARNLIEVKEPKDPTELNTQNAAAFGNNASQSAVNRSAVTAEGRVAGTTDTTANGNDLDTVQVNRAGVTAVNKITSGINFGTEEGFRFNDNNQEATAIGNVASQDSDNGAYVAASAESDTAGPQVGTIVATGNNLLAEQTNTADQTARNVFEETGGCCAQANRNVQTAVAVGNSAVQDGRNTGVIFAGPDDKTAGADGSFARGNRLAGDQVNTGDQVAVNALDIDQIGNNGTDDGGEQTALAFGNELIQTGVNRSAVTSKDGPLAIGNDLSGSQVNSGSQTALNVVRGGTQTRGITQSAQSIGSTATQSMTNTGTVSVTE